MKLNPSWMVRLVSTKPSVTLQLITEAEGWTILLKSVPVYTRCIIQSG